MPLYDIKLNRAPFRVRFCASEFGEFSKILHLRFVFRELVLILWLHFSIADKQMANICSASVLSFEINASN